MSTRRTVWSTTGASVDNVLCDLVVWTAVWLHNPWSPSHAAMVPTVYGIQKRLEIREKLPGSPVFSWETMHAAMARLTTCPQNPGLVSH